MSENRVALAVGCHPDDVEFTMAGTLSLLAKEGFEVHLHTMANGSCGTAEYDEAEIIEIRREEARKAAELMGATYHEGIVNDLMVYYQDELVRKTVALIRKIRPSIVLTHPPQDYMEDHTNTGRVTVTACFCRGMRNLFSIPPLPPTGDDVYLYHAQPYMHMDTLRNPVMPELVVDVGSEMELKEDMLRAHASQKNWLDVSQGQDSYLVTLRELCAQVVTMAGLEGVTYGEGWRRHSHIGFSATDNDLLSEVLGDRVTAVTK